MTAPSGSGSATRRPRPGDLTVVVHEALREAILRGAIDDGTWLSQVQIAKQFGVSRGPVREALRLLEREGLIEAQINQRARVAGFSVEDLDHLYATRIVTEALGITVSVPRFTEDDLGGIVRALDEMENVSGDIEAWERIHREFHLALVSYSGAPMRRVIGQRIDHSERYRRVYITQGPRVWSVGPEEHREIVDAVIERNATLAADLLARHLCRTALTVFMLAGPGHDPALIRAALRQTSDRAEEAPSDRGDGRESRLAGRA